MRNKRLIGKLVFTGIFMTSGMCQAAEYPDSKDEIFEGQAKTDMDAVNTEYRSARDLIAANDLDVRLACMGEIMIDWSDTLLKTFRSAQNLNFSNIPGNIEFSKLKADLENDRATYNDFAPGLVAAITSDIQTHRAAAKWPKSATESQLKLGEPKVAVLSENFVHCSKEDFLTRIRTASKTDYGTLAAKLGNVHTLGKDLTVIRLPEGMYKASAEKAGEFRTSLGERVEGNFKIIKTEKMTYEDFLLRVQSRK